jgi:hypothetical protein
MSPTAIRFGRWGARERWSEHECECECSHVHKRVRALVSSRHVIAVRVHVCSLFLYNIRLFLTISIFLHMSLSTSISSSPGLAARRSPRRRRGTSWGRSPARARRRPGTSGLERAKQRSASDRELEMMLRSCWALLRKQTAQSSSIHKHTTNKEMALGCSQTLGLLSSGLPSPDLTMSPTAMRCGGDGGNRAQGQRVACYT